MTVEQKIDYMIQSLHLAKEEISYAKEYLNKSVKEKIFTSMDLWDKVGIQMEQLLERV